MGIVNITPNSFSDTGAHLDPAAAIAHGQQLIKDGAAILDLGAEASSFFRPGVLPVESAEQIRRLVPVIKELAAKTDALLSIDTRSAEVAWAALAAGAHILNDVSAGTHDPAMLATAAEFGVPIILMHISPSFPNNPASDDPIFGVTVRDYLLARAAAARAAGVSAENIWVDPGIGFGKTQMENFGLAIDFPCRDDIPFPMVLGVSRKRFLTSPEFVDLAETPELAALSPLATHERDVATAAVVYHHASLPPRFRGLIHRVHNVAIAAAAMSNAG